MLIEAIPGDPDSIEPTWEHDCQACTYIGQDVRYPKNTVSSRMTIDYYACSHGPNVLDISIIGRYSSSGPEYSSAMGSSVITMREAGKEDWFTNGAKRALVAFLSRRELVPMEVKA